MTLIFHNNTDECNALVDMLTFQNAEDLTSIAANKGLEKTQPF